MSFYRTLLAAVVAAAIASPVFATDETTMQNPSETNPAMAASEQQNPGMMEQQNKVDINKASAKQLMKVKGINAFKARAVVAYRKKHGDFKSLDDLSKVKGFKKMNADQMKEVQDQLTIE